MRGSVVVTILSVFVAAGAAAGCAMGQTEGSQDGPEPTIENMLNVTDLRTFTLPLDPYRTNRANSRNTVEAERVLRQRCLQRFGFTYQLPPAPGRQNVVGNERLYGLAEEQAATAHGYHLPGTVEETKAGDGTYTDPPPEVTAVLSGRGQSTYGGEPVPEGGCAGEARRILAEGAPAVEDVWFADGLAWESYSRMEADSRVQDARARWSACMKESGFDYADPASASGDPAFSTQTASDREIAVAVADVRCKKSVNLIPVMASVHAAYEQRALETHAEALAVIRENITVRERNAAELLRGRG